MTSQIQTSTPINLPRMGNNSKRHSWLNQDVTQQLYRNSWNKFKTPEKASSPWDAIEGPKFVNFEDAQCEPRDSYFDRRKSDCPSPQRKEEMTLPTPDETVDIVSSFKSCSISAIIESSIEIEDETLVADETVNENSRIEIVEECFGTDTSTSDRRISIVQPFSFELREKENQQRRESRRAYYKMLTDRMSNHSFKAKPAPKIHQKSIAAVNIGDDDIKLENTPKIIRVPRKIDVNASNLEEMSEKQKTYNRTTVNALKFKKPIENRSQQKAKSATGLTQSQQTVPTRLNVRTIQSRTKSTTALAQPRQTPTTASNPFAVQSKAKIATAHQSPNKTKTTSNPFSFNSKAKNTLQTQHTHNTATNPFSLLAKAKNAVNPFPWQKSTAANIHVVKNEKSNEQSEEVEDRGKSCTSSAHFLPMKKQKPFQVALSRRKIEISKGPELMTAKRALERQQFEEKMKERERQKEEIKKQEAAAQQAREREEFIRLRKQTVFKARPVPQFKNILPPVQKRPLTEPTMPIFTKRRRLTTRE
ncbi:targeting protein for Xklp2 homolog [Fopius arisanus]|uniref:Targeting protein for Xklp2 homolog n=1 Tax=Fopius arisanus TaxID=64838 RepID=A0A0C9RY53_9HYME|nr:PREDICTED: targeting protein for Xklp2 homolog [Fopius arisanus]